MYRRHSAESAAIDLDIKKLLVSVYLRLQQVKSKTIVVFYFHIPMVFTVDPEVVKVGW